MQMINYLLKYIKYLKAFLKISLFFNLKHNSFDFLDCKVYYFDKLLGLECYLKLIGCKSILLLLILIFNCHTKLYSQRTFLPPVAIVGNSANYSNGIAIGDLNNDGKQDMVVSNSGQILVYINNGIDLNVSPTIYTNLNPRLQFSTIKLADINGDTKLDIICGNTSGSLGETGTSFFINQGLGVFSSPSYTTLNGLQPNTIATGDLNGDFIPELLIPTSNGQVCVINYYVGPRDIFSYIGNQSGGNVSGIDVGDLNGDGKLDIAFTKINGELSIFFKSGNGSFSFGNTFTTGLDPSDVSIADLNNDGKKDLVVVNSSSNTISVLINAGNGIFNPAINYATEQSPRTIAIGDLTEDGRLDIAVTNYNSKSVSVFNNLGNGTFETAKNYPVGNVNPYKIAIGDLNGDGLNDISTSNSGTPSATILYVKDDSFKTIWDLSIPSLGSNNQISFNANTSGNVSYRWETVPAGLNGSGIFNSENSFRVEIKNLPANSKIKLSISSSNFKQFQTDLMSVEKLIDVTQWGATNWSDMNQMFMDAINLKISAKDIPYMNNVEDMSMMFLGCESLNSPSNINNWNVSNVKDMSFLFFKNYNFNQNIDKWVVNNVTSMGAMFEHCWSFNQDISNWNVSNVKTMALMFFRCGIFDKPIGNWKVHNVESMNSMFYGCYMFNQPINNWNVEKVTVMSGMFQGCHNFNQPLNNWDIRKVKRMGAMFSHAFSFNQSLANWGSILNTDVDLEEFLNNTGLSVCNYDATLQGFANGIVTGRKMDAGGLKFANTSARNTLLTTKGWTINGDSEILNLPLNIVSSNPIPLNPTPTGGTFTFTPTLGVSIANGVLNINPAQFVGNTLSVTYATPDGCTTTKTATVNIPPPPPPLCVPTTNLKGYYAFLQSAGDASPNNVNGVVTGATFTADRFGVANSSYNFSGGTQAQPHFVELSPTQAQKVSGDKLTISVWVKITGNGYNWGRIFLGGQVNEQYTITKADGIDDRILFRPVIEGQSGNYGEVFTKAPLSRNIWHHIVAQYDGSKSSIYINGKLDNSTTGLTGNLKYNAKTSVIGGETVAHGGSNIPSVLDGAIDDVVLFDRVLDECEIKKMYDCNAECTDCATEKGLKAFFPFNGNAYDLSGNGLHGTIQSGILNSKGRKNYDNGSLNFPGGSGNFNGVGVLVNHDPILNFNDSYSFSLWFKYNANNSDDYQMLFSKGRDVNNSYGLSLKPSTGRLSFFHNNGNLTVYEAAGTLSNFESVWKNISGVVDRKSKTIYLYIDGQLLAKKTYSNLSNIMSSTNPLGIGFHEGDNGIRYPVNGLIDEVRFYDKALTPCEINNLYSCTKSCPIVDYPFCSDALDKSGNGIQLLSTNVVYDKDKFSNDNSAIKLSANSTLSTNATLLNLGKNAISMSVWIKPESQSSLFQNIINKSAPVNGYFLGYNWGEAGVISFGVGGGSPSTSVNIITTNTFDVNQWYHVVAVLDVATKRAYIIVNGEKQPIQKYGGSGGILIGNELDFTGIYASLNASSASDFKIGNTKSSPDGFVGNIDQVKIYDTALKLTEIDDLFKEQSPCSGPIADYNFCGNVYMNTPFIIDGVQAQGFLKLNKDRFNYPNTALALSGANSLKFRSVMDLSNGHTFSFWINPSTNISSQNVALVSNWDGASTPITIDLTSTRKIQYMLNGFAANNILESNTTLQANTWYHIMATWDKGEMKLYINNQLDNSKSFTTPLISNTNLFYVGQKKDLSNSFYTGLFDDFKVYNRAISDSEMNFIYNQSAPCTTLVIDPVADFPICSDFEDVSGNNNVLTDVSGTYSLNRKNNDGSAITVPMATLTGPQKANLDFGKSSFTLSTWFKLDNVSSSGPGFPNNEAFLSNGAYAFGSSFFNPQKQICFKLQGSDIRNSVSIMTNATYGDNVWHLATAVVDRVNEKISIYVDGNKQSISKHTVGGRGWSVQTFGTVTPDNDLDIQFGYILNASSTVDFNIGSPKFKGSLDNIKIYNRALSQQEISDLYLSNPNDCSGPVAAYPFCGNAKDATVNNNDGTVNGATLAPDRFGNQSSAFNFDGIGQHILFPNKKVKTVSMWINIATTQAQNNAMIFSNFKDVNLTKSPEHDRKIFGISYFKNGSVYLNPGYITGEGLHFWTGWNDVAIPITNFSGGWHHVCVSTENNKVFIRVDGVLVDGYKFENSAWSAKVTQPFIFSNSFDADVSSDLIVGGVLNNSFFKGSIDDIRIYDRLLNPNEINALINCNNALVNPLVTRNNNSLSTPVVSGKKYQWYKNNQLIVGATSSSYTFTSESAIAVYKVNVSNLVSECSCGNFSTDECVFPSPKLVVTDPAGVCAPLKVDITKTWVDGSNYSANGSCVIGALNQQVTYWKDAAATSQPLTQAEAEAIATSGTYYIKLYTIYGQDIKPVGVLIKQQPTFGVTQPNAVCLNNTPPIDLANQITGGVFTDGSFSAFDVNPITNPSATPLTSTIINQVVSNKEYFIKRTNECGLLVKSFKVTIYPLPSAHSISSLKDRYCRGSNVNFTSTFATVADANKIALVINDAPQTWLNIVQGGTLQHTLTYNFVNNGIYSVKVIAQNQNGCVSYSQPISIEIKEPTVSVLSTEPISCWGQSDGKVKFKITNNFSGAYQNNFNWNITGTNKSGVSPEGDIEVLNMPYSINSMINVVQQVTGCTAGTSLNIGYGGPQVSNVCIPNVLCSNQNYIADFKFTISALSSIYSGKTFTANLKAPNGVIFSSQTASFGTEFIIPVSNPIVGEYRLSISNLSGGIACNDLDYRFNTQPLKPTLSTDKPVIAKCPSDGNTINSKVNLNFEMKCGQAQPTGNFQYTSLFTPTNGVARPGASGVLSKGDNIIQIDSPDEGGTTVISLSSPNGYCISEPLSIKVDPIRNFSASLSKKDPLCFNSSNGIISVLVTGGSGQLSYKWYKYNVEMNEYGAEIRNLGAGDYKVIITDLANPICADLKTLSTTLVAPDPIATPNKPIQGLIDGNKNCSISSFTTGGGTPNYNFHWYYIYESTRQTFDRNGNIIPGTPYVKETVTTELFVDQNIAQNEKSELKPEKVKVNLGEYYVIAEDINGCFSEKSEKTMLESPLLQRTYNLCFAWKSRPDPADNPIDITNTIQAGLGPNVKRIEQELKDEEAKCMGAVIGKVKGDFSQNCSNVDKVKDNVGIEFDMGKHKQFTLYYYDRAGRLVQTVPPQGIQLAASRVPTVHKLKTIYTYNSIGELLTQNTPDGGTSAFIYNRRGQLRFSQNAKQNNADPIKSKYSYTTYDDLNRITEVGEESGTFTTLATEIDSETEANATPADFPRATSITSKEKTKTVYTQPNTDGVTYLGNPQRNLLNRVSYTTTENQVGGAKSATYYSYDVHGNVEWLIQDIPMVGKNTIEYDYDLISGKVNAVVFNKSKPNQFYHRYSYDEDNRITAVETSKDNVIWDKDASYDYYSHGPLKRVSLGQDKVQGIDYTYTLQGWLKGINTASLLPSIDPGKDGGAGGTGFEKDVFGMELGYYQGDFVKPNSPFHSTSASNLGDVGALPIDNGATASARKNLYNGNIAAWASNMNVSSTMEYNNVPTAFSYTYDKLNRLKSNKMYVANANDQFVAERNEPFSEKMTYDKNGNILTLKRTGRNQTLNEFDNLSYVYKTDISGKLISNQLISVTDNSQSPMNTILNDISGTSAYTYDAIGNLIADAKERINIKWNVYGKIAEIIPFAPETNKKDKPHIIFYYDASGNRIVKQVNRKPYNGTNTITISDPSQVTTTYYVRDASGNVMHVYERTDEFIKKINNEQSIYKTILKANETPMYGSDRLGMYKPEQVLLEKYYTNDATFDYAAISLQLMEDTRVAGLSGFRTVLTQDVANPSRNRFSMVDINPKTGATTPASANLTNIAGINSGVLDVENKEGQRMFSAIISRSGSTNISRLNIYNKYGALMKRSSNLNLVCDANAKLLAVKDFSTTGNQYYLLYRTTSGLYKYLTINPDAMGYSTAALPAGEVVGAVSDMPSTLAFGRNPVAIEDYIAKKSYIFFTRYNANTSTFVRFQTKDNGVAGFDNSNLAYSPTYTTTDINGDAEMAISPDAKTLSVYVLGKNMGSLPIKNAGINTYNLLPNYTIENTNPIQTNVASGVLGKASLAYDKNMPSIYYRKRNGASNDVFAKPVASTSETTSPVWTNILSDIALSRSQNTFVYALSNTSFKFVDAKFNAQTSNLTGTTMRYAGLLSSAPVRVYKQDPTDFIAKRTVGNKEYELKDHLGNVRVVVGDNVVNPNPTSTVVAPLVYESFETLGLVHGQVGGIGWQTNSSQQNENAWWRQNAELTTYPTSEEDYHISNIAPLSYANLRTNGGYLRGGAEWQNAGRSIQVRSAGQLNAFIGVINGTNCISIGQPWISFMLRKETDDNEDVILKLANANISWYGSDAGVEIGYFSENPFAIVNGEKQWAIKYNAVISGGFGSFVYGYKYKNLGPLTVNKTAFFVLSLEYFGAPISIDPSFRPMFITAILNPDASTLGKTITLNPSDRVTAIAKPFRNVVFYGGNSKGKGSMDEFRIGSSYAAVTPTVANNRIDIRYAANYYPFGAPMPGRSFSAGLAYRYGFNGHEKDDEVKGAGNHLSFGDYGYDPRIGRRWNIEPEFKKLPNLSSYVFASNSPISRLDADGNWDVEVHAFNDRALFGYAILIAKNRDGNEVFRTVVKVQGSAHTLNGNNPRDRTLTNADTPTGTYDMTNWESKSGTVKSRKSYGPNQVIRLNGITGEIQESGRAGILVHGGRQESYDSKQKEWSSIENPVLKNTYGCIRIFDNSISELKNLTDQLQANDPLESMGNLNVSNDLIFDGESSSYFTPSDYQELGNARRNMVWSTDFSGSLEQISNAKSKGVNNQTITQPQANDTEEN